METFYLVDFRLFFLNLEMDRSYVWSELNWEQILISEIYNQLGIRVVVLYSLYISCVS